MASECKSKKVSVYCKVMDVHHRSLCSKKKKKKKSTVIRESAQIVDEFENNTCESPESENALLFSKEIVLMQTAYVKIRNPKSFQNEKLRLLLNLGSLRAYISEKLANSLKLERKQDRNIQLVTFGSDKTKIIKISMTKLTLESKNGKDMSIFANVVPTITGTIQRKQIHVKERHNLETLTENLCLADSIPSQIESSTIDLLIGNDYYLDIIMGHKIEVQKGLYLLSSRLGWILTGRTDEIDEDCRDVNMLILTYGNNITTRGP